MIIRTQDEILNHYLNVVKEYDPIGFTHEDLLDYLDFEHIKPYLKEEAQNKENAEEEWNKDVDLSKAYVLNTMRGYLSFAFEKAECERGLSANRSICHFINWAWLIDDDLYKELIRRYEHEYGDDGGYGITILRYIQEWLKKEDLDV